MHAINAKQTNACLVLFFALTAAIVGNFDGANNLFVAFHDAIITLSCTILLTFLSSFFISHQEMCVCVSHVFSLWAPNKVYVCAEGKERKSEEEKEMRAKEPELPVALSKATSPRLDT